MKVYLNIDSDNISISAIPIPKPVKATGDMVGKFLQILARYMLIEKPFSVDSEFTKILNSVDFNEYASAKLTELAKVQSNVVGSYIKACKLQLHAFKSSSDLPFNNPDWDLPEGTLPDRTAYSMEQTNES